MKQFLFKARHSNFFAWMLIWATLIDRDYGFLWMMAFVVPVVSIDAYFTRGEVNI